MTTIPKGFTSPRWQQTLHYTLRPLSYMDAAARRYGDIFNAPVFGKHQAVLFLSHPDAIKQLFTSDSSLISAPKNQLLQPIVGDRSIFCMEGQRHLRERKLLMPPFHGERISTCGELIYQLTEKALEKVSGRPLFVARDLMQDISLEVILKVVFGIYEGERFRRLKRAIVDFTAAFQNPLFASALFFPALQKDWGPFSPWGYLLTLQRDIRKALQEEIEERRVISEGDRFDILSLLMAARDEHGEPMTDEELRDELVTLLLAGHETTATATAWALYWVHRLPDVGKKLRAELQSRGSNQDPMEIAQLPYLTAICNEALRIYPVAVLTVPREVKAPLEIMGYRLDVGSRLYGCIYLTHRRPELYPDPETFRPERFLERQYSMYEFLPFGGGVRRCIGEALARLEMKLVLATLLSRYSFELVDRTPEIPQRRGVTVAPARGVRLRLVKD